MAYLGALFEREFPGFRDEDHILEKQYRDRIAAHLPSEAVDAIEVACIDHRMSKADEGHSGKAESLERVRIAAEQLSQAFDSLSGYEVRTLLSQLDVERPGRWFRKDQSSSYFVQLRRIVMQPYRGERAIWRLLLALRVAASRAANLVLQQQSPIRLGRPESREWELAAAVGAIGLTFGLNPSEGSRAFVEVIEAVWEGIGIPAKPTHAMRTMRKVLKDRTVGGAEHVLRIALLRPVFVLTTDGRGRLRCDLRDPDLQFKRRLEARYKTKSAKASITGTSKGD